MSSLKMDDNLCKWEEDVLEHYYKEPERSEIREDIKRFKSEYHSIYHELPFERIMLAVYKCGKSKRKNLCNAIELAKTDWRDLLVRAKFANNIKAHINWKADLMQSITNRKMGKK